MDEKLKLAVELYKSGKTLKQCLKEAHIEEQRFRRYLIQESLLRSRSDQIRAGKSSAVINDHALDTLTPEALYWIGFLVADGHIEKDRPRITTTLSMKDNEHLLKMGRFFGKGLVTRTVKGSGKSEGEEFSRLCFTSKPIYEKLKSLGLHSRKSWSLTLPDELKYSRDFWRGVVDGDGWVLNKTVFTVGLCGTQETVSDFLKFINWAGVNSGTNARQVKNKGLWTCDLHHNVAKKVSDLLYKDSPVHLDRKYQIYQDWFGKSEIM